MALLTNLKLVAAKRSTQVSPNVRRRIKLLKQLHEQICIANAVSNGSTYAPTKLKRVLSSETGLRTTVSVPKRVKQWWFDNNGKCVLMVRYGARVLELARGKNAIECEMTDLVSTLELLRTAITAGELDTQLEEAAQNAIKRSK